jgi:hypothetical protein
MSERTLARKLSDEGLNFTEILQQLRRDLAVRYLDDCKLHVSKIAWLLGFREVSACRWPISNSGAEDFCFCGNEPVKGLPHCLGHARIAYRPVGRQRSSAGA